jgi:hypothetical protein
MNSKGAVDRPRRLALLPACAGIIGCCLLSGCGIQAGTPSPAGTVTGRNSTGTASSTPHSDSDPGDRKLHMLAADPVLAELPAGLAKTDEKQIPAHYETPGFGSGGSFGAGVSVTFTSAASIPDVYRMIGENAVRNGWVAKAADSTGMTNRWLKTYPDGSPATLILTCKDQNATATTRSCTLDGGI